MSGEWTDGMYFESSVKLKPAVNNKAILVVTIGCSMYAVSSKEEFYRLFGEVGKDFLTGMSGQAPVSTPPPVSMTPMLSDYERTMV